MAEAAYEPDTIVVDVEDPAHQPRRRPSSELTMQVRHDDGKWHRRMPDLSETACGLPLYRLGQQLRIESLAENLCEECFTKRERERSAVINAKAREGAL
jgi:hypothetical protein